jgi:DNA-binding beta-propeller fold protein YncE
VAITSHGDVLVSEYEEAERVQRYRFGPAGLSPSKTGARPELSLPPTWIGNIGRPGNGPGEFNRPEGICVDSADRIYVADSCNHRIQVFDSEGKFLRSYGKPGKGLGELSYPYDICVDKTGRQYVCEFGNSRIQVFDANDRPIEIIGSPGAEPGRFNNPWGVGLDSAGNLYVADSQNHRLQKLLRRP